MSSQPTIQILPSTQTSGGSLKQQAVSLTYNSQSSPDAALWASAAQALQSAQSQIDAITSALRQQIAIPASSSAIAPYPVPIVAGTATPDASQPTNLLILTAAVCLTDPQGNKYVNVAPVINYGQVPGQYTPWQLITQEDPVFNTGGYSTVFDPSYVIAFAVASAQSPANTQCHVDFKTDSNGKTTPTACLIDQPIS